MAVLMQKGLTALPPSALSYAYGFCGAGAAAGLIDALAPRVSACLPSAISVGIGMYLTPDWTIPRVVGAIIELVRAPNPTRGR